MIYTFGEDQDGVKISVDTENPEIQRRVAWVARMCGLAVPPVREYLNTFPGATIDGNLDPNKLIGLAWGQYEFEKDGRRVPVDVRIFADGAGLVPRLQGAVSWLNIGLGLGISLEAIQGMIYEEPAPTDPAEDWQAPGSPMAEPLPGQPGRYKSRGMGRQIGDVWTGPSGARYVLTNIGGIFQYLAWVRNA